MKVGFSIKEINPNIGCQMEGYAPRNSTGIHDNLTVSAIFINNSFILISLDLVAIPGFRVEQIKRKLHEKFDINNNHIIISAIHTHSGPTITDLLIDYPKIDAEYWRLINNQAIKAVSDAKKNQSESTISLINYKVPDGIYANRNNLKLPYNNNIFELRFSNNKVIKASLVLIATHPTVLNITNTLISADLIAGIREQYRKIHDIIPMCMLSDCADTSTRFTRKESSFNEITRLSNIIGEALQHPLKEKTLSWDLLAIKRVEQKCNYDPISNPKAIDLYQEIQKKYNTAPNKEKKEKLVGLLDTYKHIRYFGHTHFSTSAYIYEFKNFRIITYPGELVFALGNKIRHIDDKPTLLITLANDYRGYSVDKQEFGKYFESYNSVFLKGMADEFVDKIIATCAILK
ncbi:MAG: neutral/alkaline non-lysosomal ceramidase N-terminal domain-containing protein [Lactobacillus sp.]|nr:neutral/alkaline non-lysosomal ceramidase N-terminal domain-containing protein [Lactobacillus sp.]